MKKALFLWLIFLSGCIEKDSSQTGLVPLAVGNSWTYVDTETGEESTSSVESKQLVNGVYWFKYNELGDSFWVRNEGLDQFEAIDFFNEQQIDSTIGEEVLVLTTSKNKYAFQGIKSASYKRCDTLIKVPAGEFECHIIHFEFGEQLFSRNYYAEGIGLIKNQYQSSDGYTEVELVDYQLR